VPLVQVSFDSRVNSDTSRIRTPLKAIRRAPPCPPPQDHASNLFVCYASQSLINFEKKKCIIYIDKMIIFSTSFEQHKKDIREVLERMREYEVIAKLKKCEIAKKEVTYLGH